jgi:hypothetical protein
MGNWLGSEMISLDLLRSRITSNLFFWYAVICVAGLAVWSMITNIGQRHYLTETALTFAAQFVYIGSLATGLGLGIWLGVLVGRRTSRTWAGWAVGIAVFGAVTIGIREIGHEIPGVGWRVKAIESYEPLD